jgi:hypothetical protein
MPSEKQYTSLVERHGFVSTPEPGFVSFQRDHPDGRRQLLRFFCWSNKKHAAAAGIPRSYIVVCLGLDRAREICRLRLPLVEWPSVEQPARPWRDVVEEFNAVVLPALDAPSVEGHLILERLEQRHLLASSR